jgi:hypothetical protein
VTFDLDLSDVVENPVVWQHEVSAIEFSESGVEVAFLVEGGASLKMIASLLHLGSDFRGWLFSGLGRGDAGQQSSGSNGEACQTQHHQ